MPCHPATSVPGQWRAPAAIKLDRGELTIDNKLPGCSGGRTQLRARNTAYKHNAHSIVSYTVRRNPIFGGSLTFRAHRPHYVDLQCAWGWTDLGWRNRV